MSYGANRVTVEVNCPRDCGGAVSVEVLEEWDDSVHSYSVEWLSGPEPTDCECGELVEAEKAVARALAEDLVIEGDYE